MRSTCTAPDVRVLFVTPAFWPAVAFGGPIAMARELTRGLLERGHDVEVITTGLRGIGEPPADRFRTTRATVDGVPVTYLATPARYRWMGITPSLPLALRNRRALVAGTMDAALPPTIDVATTQRVEGST